MLVGLICLTYLFDYHQSIARQVLEKIIHSEPGKFHQLLSFLSVNLNPDNYNLYFIGLSTVVIFWFACLKPKSNININYLILVLVFSGLYFGNYPIMRYAEKDSLYMETDSIAYIKNLAKIDRDTSSPPYRFVSIADENCGTAMPFRFLEYFSLEQAGGYTSIYSKNYRSFSQRVYAGRNDEIDKELFRHSVNFGGSDLPLLKYAAAKYFLTAPDCHLNVDDFSILKKFSDLNVYQLKSFLPRAYIVDRYSEAANSKSALSQMAAENFDPLKTVVLTSGMNNLNYSMEDTGKILLNDNHKHEVILTKYSGNVRKFSVNTQGPDSFLVLLDNHLPGWVAYINGKEAEIYTAFSSFMSLKLPKGKSEVELVYRPPNFNFYLLSSFFGSCIWVLVIFSFWVFPKFRMPHDKNNIKR
jgi:hypothetical protein